MCQREAIENEELDKTRKGLILDEKNERKDQLQREKGAERKALPSKKEGWNGGGGRGKGKQHTWRRKALYKSNYTFCLVLGQINPSISLSSIGADHCSELLSVSRAWYSNPHVGNQV